VQLRLSVCKSYIKEPTRLSLLSLACASGFPQSDRVPAQPGPTAERGRTLRHGGIYDTETGSHLIAHFPLLPPYIETAGTLPPYGLMLMLDLPVLLAVNSTLYGAGRQEKSGAETGKDPDQEFGPRHIPPTGVTTLDRNYDGVSAAARVADGRPRPYIPAT
jgi:hypothetical protein